MFRKQLHKDLDGISPDEELLLKITKSMQEEVQKPRPKMYTKAIRFGGMAAAVCMIAVGGIALTSNNGLRNEEVGSAPANIVKSAENNTAAETTAAMQAEFYAEAENFSEKSENAPSYVDSVEGICLEETADSVCEAAEESGTITKEETSDNIFGAITLPEYANKGIYKANAETPDVIGMPQTLEEFMSNKERNKNINSFCRIRIVDIIDPATAKELNGWNEYYSDDSAFFYEAVIEYDYFLEKEISNPIIFRQSGNNYGSPAYATGDVIAALVMNPEGEITRLFSYAFIYDLYEINGLTFGASRGQSIPEIEDGLTNYFDAKTVAHETTTLGNPAVYYGLFEIDKLAENLKAVIDREKTAISPDMTHHTLTTEIMHCSETGGIFLPNDSETANVEFSLPSDWELSATVASLDGIKIFEIGPPCPSSETYNYDSFKTDDVNGSAVMVHEEKFGTADDPYLYYIYVTVSGYNVKFYVINCGDYSLFLHFNADHNVSEQTVFDIINSVKVTRA